MVTAAIANANGNSAVKLQMCPAFNTGCNAKQDVFLRCCRATRDLILSKTGSAYNNDGMTFDASRAKLGAQKQPWQIRLEKNQPRPGVAKMPRRKSKRSEPGLQPKGANPQPTPQPHQNRGSATRPARMTQKAGHTSVRVAKIKIKMM
ncbi:hypothetical protein [Thalassospira mesophila]|uniref:hypothetical protein n=1 Tax=Thalassospira mesophila TaxID=1293891 RepID=UPI00117C9917|nr:hypothetical protein [Thalassospira mesophila]